MDVLRQSWNQRFGFLFVLLIFTGCASGYREPSIPRNEMATLNASSPVWVVSIDGKKVSRTGITGHKHFRVSPGTHLVEVQYSQLSPPLHESSGSMTYTFQDRAF